ncbi:hypothetical protein SK128_028496 [Halocaridina rubra]|uniref:Uncharacterized protein n=1 Tax=Halocaridina rubra TaxID=373956 RepID=A0AAN8XIL0_HALRR
MSDISLSDGHEFDPTFEAKDIEEPMLEAKNAETWKKTHVVSKKHIGPKMVYNDVRGDIILSNVLLVLYLKAFPYLADSSSA